MQNERIALSPSAKTDISFIFLVLYALFFCSGYSALIYQVIWQRMLFTVFGVDLESITIIVSVFMFGLGIGGICGGILADKMSSRLLFLYILFEILIAAFGFCSPYIIEGLGNMLFSENKLVTGIASFVILAFPTTLMGATFPILVTYINKFYHHIGRSVGNLYFFNTLGAATGAYFSGFILLYLMDLVGAINLAAMINLIIAIVAIIVFRREQ
jgi:predicted membrane-bound spermidine synthase